MIQTIRAEFRKIYSIRSTYVTLLAIVALIALVAFWIYGYKDVAHAGKNTGVLAEVLFNLMSVVGIFAGFLALLSVGHEYRYNTILYSLTSTNSRTKLFFSKWFVLLCWSVVVAIASMVLAYGAFLLGQGLHNVPTVTQEVDVLNVLLRALVSVAGSMSFAYIIAMLLRSQVGSIALYLVLPTTIESLLFLLLKENVKYLPFTALGNVSTQTPNVPLHISLTMVAVYIAVGGIISWLLFSRRDAN